MQEEKEELQPPPPQEGVNSESARSDQRERERERERAASSHSGGVGPLNEASERASGPAVVTAPLGTAKERLGRPWNDAAMKGTHGRFRLLGNWANNMTTRAMAQWPLRSLRPPKDL